MVGFGGEGADLAGDLGRWWRFGWVWKSGAVGTVDRQGRSVVNWGVWSDWILRAVADNGYQMSVQRVGTLIPLGRDISGNDSLAVGGGGFGCVSRHDALWLVWTSIHFICGGKGKSVGKHRTKLPQRSISEIGSRSARHCIQTILTLPTR